MKDREISITFQPDGQVIGGTVGVSALKAVLDTGRPIGYSCRGRGVCTACVLWVSGPASEILEAESQLLSQLGPSSRSDGAVQRIACLARLMGDVEIQADYW